LTKKILWRSCPFVMLSKSLNLQISFLSSVAQYYFITVDMQEGFWNWSWHESWCNQSNEPLRCILHAQCYAVVYMNLLDPRTLNKFTTQWCIKRSTQTLTHDRHYLCLTYRCEYSWPMVRLLHCIVPLTWIPSSDTKKKQSHHFFLQFLFYLSFFFKF
jgi:hypothetical protein